MGTGGSSPRPRLAFQSLLNWAIINPSTEILHFWVASPLQEVPAHLTAKLITLHKQRASVGHI